MANGFDGIARAVHSWLWWIEGGGVAVWRCGGVAGPVQGHGRGWEAFSFGELHLFPLSSLMGRVPCAKSLLASSAFIAPHTRTSHTHTTHTHTHRYVYTFKHAHIHTHTLWEHAAKQHLFVDLDALNFNFSLHLETTDYMRILGISARWVCWLSLVDECLY